MHQIVQEFPKVLADSRHAQAKLFDSFVNGRSQEEATTEEGEGEGEAVEPTILNIIMYPFVWTVSWLW